MARKPITDPSEIPVIFDGRDAKKSTDAEIELRRMDVINCRLQGLTVAEIAKKLGFSEHTIRKDLEFVRESNKQYVSEFEQQDFVADTLAMYRNLEEAAYESMRKVPKGDSRITKFISEIRATRKASIELLQNVGLVKSEVQRPIIPISVTVLNSWTPEQQSHVAASILDAAIEFLPVAEVVEKNSYAELNRLLEAEAADIETIDMVQLADFTDDVEEDESE